MVREVARQLATEELDAHLVRHPGSVHNRDGWVRAKTAEVLERHGPGLAAVAAEHAVTIGHDATLLRRLWSVWRRSVAADAAAEVGTRAAEAGTDPTEFEATVARYFAGDSALAVIALDAYRAHTPDPGLEVEANDPLVARAHQIANRHTHPPTTEA